MDRLGGQCLLDIQLPVNPPYNAVNMIFSNIRGRGGGGGVILDGVSVDSSCGLF